MSILTLQDLCLNEVSLSPAACLRTKAAPEGEPVTHPAILKCVANDFLACGDCEGPKALADPWGGVEAATVAAVRAARPEARPQLVKFLASRGVLMDGVLPDKFFEGLRVDALSLSASRSREPFVLLAGAQKRMAPGERLVTLDLGSCLQLDDHMVATIVEACPGLVRLSLRDCRKLTAAAFDCLNEAKALADVDVGGNFNMTIAGASGFLTSRAKRPREGEPLAALTGFSAAGLGPDDAFLETCATRAPGLRRLGLGFGAFTSAGLVGVAQRLSRLVDLRVQWTETFDDAALDAVSEHCTGIKALDALGTNVSVDCIQRLLMAHVHDSALGPQPNRRLAYLNVKYTAGPILQLKNLPEAWQYAKTLTIVVGAK